MFDTVEFTEENETTFIVEHAKFPVLATQIFFDSKMMVLKSIEILMSFAQRCILVFRHLQG